jgi:hypothetical protein
MHSGLLVVSAREKKTFVNWCNSNSLCIHPAVVLRISIYLIRQTQLFLIIDGFIILLL